MAESAAAFPFWVNALDARPATSRASCTLRVGDLFACDQSDPSEVWHTVLLSSYLTDLNWLLGAAPHLGLTRDKLCILSGQKGTATVLRASTAGTGVRDDTFLASTTAVNPMLAAFEAHRLDTNRLVVLEPPLPFAYGTHHSKFALCVNDRGLRVAVFTANLIHSDWAYKTQGIYLQDFPRCVLHDKQTPRTVKGDDFKHQLAFYLRACGLACQENPSASPLGVLARRDFLDAFNFADVKVWLLPSTPGSRRADDAVQGGWRRLQQVLARVPLCSAVPRMLTWQYSSQGTLNSQFIEALIRAMVASPNASCGAGRGTTEGVIASAAVRVVYPTQQEVRESLEGWRGGLALPLRMQGCHPFVNERLHRWTARAPPDARRYALPHLKTYARIVPDARGGSLAWFVLTSANLSQAAWGTVAKTEGQPAARSVIRSYELGVLFDASSAVSLSAAPTQPTAPTNTARFSTTPSHPLHLPTRQAASDLIPTRVWTPSPAHEDGDGEPELMLPYDVVSPQPYASNAAVQAHNAMDGAASASAVSARDVPWVLDFPHRGQDALGRTFEEAMREETRLHETAHVAPERRFTAAPKRPRAEGPDASS